MEENKGIKGTRHRLSAFFVSLAVIFSLLVFSACGQRQSHTLEFDSAHELRTFFRWEPDQAPMISAHRGGSYPGYPENSLETFSYTIDGIPAVIECDVRRTSDGVLVMMHDETLDRTTTCTGKVEDLNYEELGECYLKDLEGTVTSFRVPTLAETLDWADARTVLMLDVKRGIDFEDVIREVNELNAADRTVIITYTPDAAAKVFEIDPELMISVTVRNRQEWQRLMDRGLPPENLIAFTGVGEPENDIYEVLHGEGVTCILGTMGNLDRRAAARGDAIYQELVRNGADMLSTDRPFEAYDAIRTIGGQE